MPFKQDGFFDNEISYFTFLEKLETDVIWCSHAFVYCALTFVACVLSLTFWNWHGAPKHEISFVSLLKQRALCSFSITTASPCVRHTTHAHAYHHSLVSIFVVFEYVGRGSPWVEPVERWYLQRFTCGRRKQAYVFFVFFVSSAFFIRHWERFKWPDGLRQLCFRCSLTHLRLH